MDNERWLYRLDGVTHIAETIDEEPTRYVYSVRRQQNMPLHDRIIPYLERAGLYHLARLNTHWFWLDEPLLSAFIERWRPETHTFHMPFGECTITLQDVAYQLGLPVDGQAVSSYSWGAAALAWLYRCMCRVANRNVTSLAGPLQLLQSWIFWRFPMLRPQGFNAFSFPLASRWATYLPTSDGKEQRIIQYRLALDRLTHRDRVPDPGPSAEYLDWWHHVAHRILSPGIAFADPRLTQVPDDAILRGSSQAPTRVPASDMPDNRRVERRRRIGTRATNREWRWLNDMMQKEQVGGDDGGQADHRLRRSTARRWTARGGRALPVHHDDEVGSSRRHPTDTHVGGTAEASMGGTPFTHVSSSQVLYEYSTQLLADLATTSFTMNLDDQLGGPQFYANFAEMIQGDDVHQYQSPIPGGPSDPPKYRPQPADVPSQILETQLPVDLNEPAGSPYNTWFGMGGRHHLHLELGHRRLHREIGERLGLGVRLDVAQARTYLVNSGATMINFFYPRSVKVSEKFHLPWSTTSENLQK
ncbi:hypothetical protein Ahy_B09g098939 [Arachis hypogaea]|uniref:Aminotransferase-like plant mobile domain-containing protein n=1 Tax=Arachis hypogaea TaxID=3818 RepID=A0A444XSN9_ARAHY|nr:hypothetical protein Ahy_B09g098939 [Arachis hypogaea]